MDRFSTLFGEEFDYEALANGEISPLPVDTHENLQLLSGLQSSGNVYFLHVRIGEELSECFVFDRNVGNIDLREKGGELYKKGKYEEALKVYFDAIALNPFEVRNFSNAAICLIALGRNEEANTYASIGTDVEPRFSKIHLLVVKSACNMGCVESARHYGESVLDKIPPNELYSYMEEFDRLIKGVPRDRRKAMDSYELEVTVNRLLSPDQGPPEAYVFLLQHVLELTAKSNEDMEKKHWPILMRCMTEAPYIKDFIKDPAQWVDKLTLGLCRVLGLFITSFKYHCEDSLKACENLISNPLFPNFFSKLGLALMKRSAVQRNFSKVGPGYLFSCFFGSFIYLLAALAKYPTIRDSFLKTTPPFNDWRFYIHLLALDPCVFDTRDSPDTNMFVETFTTVILEPWSLEKIESLPDEQIDHTVSIMATASTIFLQCRSVNFRSVKPPFASFLPLWLKLSEHSKFAPILARRPGVFHHFAVRLEYATQEFEDLIEYRHHRTHLKETLHVVQNLTAHLPHFHFFDDEISSRFRAAFLALFKCVATLKCKGKLADFVNTTTKNAFEILTRLFEISPSFAENIQISKEEESVFEIIAMSAFSKERSPEVSSAGIACLKTLVKNANSAKISEWVGTSDFPDVIAKLVRLLEQAEGDEFFNENKRLSIEILCKLMESLSDESDKEGWDAFWKALTVANPAGLVKGVANFICQNRECTANGELLLAKLLTSSKADFSDEARGKLDDDDEMVRNIVAIAQEKLDSCKSENDRKALGDLVAALKI